MATRRVFLKNTAIAAAGIGLAPTVSGKILGSSPADRINIGVIGCNGSLCKNLFFQNKFKD